MDALTPAEIEQLADPVSAFMRFEEESNTLVIDQVALQLDDNLGDDDLGAELLIESLEQQYQDMVIASAEEDDELLALQSTKEWAASNRERLAGLFRYLRSLSA